MAASPLNPKTRYHSRSISLPSRPHPLVPQFEEHLCRLKAFETTSSSSSTISHKLCGLKDLHDFVNKLLVLPLTQHALAQECHEKWVDELLDGSLRLLDVCNGAKDALLHTKEQVHDLQSILRRRRGGEFGLANVFEEYLSCRKKVKKAIHKAIKGMERKCTNKDHVPLGTTVSILREVEAITLSVFESFLFFIAGPKSSSWSLVSKLVHPKRVACDDEETDRNALEMVDAALRSLIRHKTSKADNIMSVENVQNKLGKLELSIQDLEEGLECLFKSLIKTRVSLLNIFNH